jgi:lysozyme family protein
MTIKDIVGAAAYDPRFAKWLEFELLHECEYVKGSKGPEELRTIRIENVPGDGGGPTFAGVDYSSHRGFPFSNPKPTDVIAAYRADWNACRANELKDPVGETVANFGVNRGNVTAAKLLQQALRHLPDGESIQVDGAIGPNTLRVANSASDPLKLALLIVSIADVQYEALAKRAARYRQFLRGWLARDQDLREFDKRAAA